MKSGAVSKIYASKYASDPPLYPPPLPPPQFDCVTSDVTSQIICRRAGVGAPSTSHLHPPPSPFHIIL